MVWSHRINYKFISIHIIIWRIQLIRSRNCWHFTNTWVYPRSFFFFFMGSVLLIFWVFCVVLLYIFAFGVPCCDVRYDFRMKAKFGVYLPPVVCRRAHILFTLFVFVCVWWPPMHVVLCFCSVFLHSMYPVMLVSLDCLFYYPSVLCNFY